MTINQFMRELEIESSKTATDYACEAALINIYAADTSYSMANESTDLIFDDADDYSENTYTSATESFGSKLGGMFDTVKGWFQKMATAIKEWVKGLVEKYKRHARQAKEKERAKNIAGINADIAATKENNAVAEKTIREQLATIEEKLKTASSYDERSKLQTKREQLKAKLESTTKSGNAALTALATKLAKIFVEDLVTAYSKVKSAFDQATGIEETLYQTLLKVLSMAAKDSDTKGQTIRDAVKFDDAYDNNGSVGKVGKLSDKVNNAIEAQYKQVEKLEDQVDKISGEADNLVDKVKEAEQNFKDKVPDKSVQTLAIATIKTSLGIDAMAKDGGALAEKCDKLSNITGTIANQYAGKNGELTSKAPAIAKYFKSYSAVAAKISRICRAFISIGNTAAAAVAAPEYSKAAAASEWEDKWD